MTKPKKETEKTLTKEEMWELRALTAEAKLAETLVNLRAIERETFLIKIDPTQKLVGLMAELKKQSEVSRLAKEQLLSLRTKIESRLGVNLDEYAYDDVTGVLEKMTG